MKRLKILHKVPLSASSDPVTINSRVLAPLSKHSFDRIKSVHHPNLFFQWRDEHERNKSKHNHKVGSFLRRCCRVPQSPQVKIKVPHTSLNQKVNAEEEEPLCYTPQTLNLAAGESGISLSPSLSLLSKKRGGGYRDKQHSSRSLSISLALVFFISWLVRSCSLSFSIMDQILVISYDVASCVCLFLSRSWWFLKLSRAQRCLIKPFTLHKYTAGISFNTVR